MRLVLFTTVVRMTGVCLFSGTSSQSHYRDPAEDSRTWRSCCLLKLQPVVLTQVWVMGAEFLPDPLRHPPGPVLGCSSQAHRLLLP